MALEETGLSAELNVKRFCLNSAEEWGAGARRRNQAAATTTRSAANDPHRRSGRHRKARIAPTTATVSFARLETGSALSWDPGGFSTASTALARPDSLSRFSRFKSLRRSAA